MELDEREDDERPDLEEPVSDDDEAICPACSGSGEGQYEGSRCRSCRGSGITHAD